MKVIGITGGVGGGKSTVTDILREQYKAYLINTDQIAHTLMQKGEISYQLIINHFGTGVLDEHGNISRSLLGALVYQAPDKLRRLNSFTHPYVMEQVKEIINQKREENVPIVCVETALPKEAGLKEICDEIWYIYAPEELRRERLIKSRNYSDDKISGIFMNQIKHEEYKQISTHMIQTDCSMEHVREQINFLLEK
ncbi:MAG: hypothetical protein K0R92_331 [Lachnospiraceae bacterium]|jgi:dephospho-CoA kinase|nr:hypothetical protein [Lachnospiraceae bacterium]